MDKTHRQCPVFFLSGRIISGSNYICTGDNVNWKQLTKTCMLNDQHWPRRNTGQLFCRLHRQRAWAELEAVHVGKPGHCDGEMFSWGEDGLQWYICNDPHSRPGPEPPLVDIWNSAEMLLPSRTVESENLQSGGQELAREDGWSLGTKMLGSGRPDSKKQNLKVKNHSSNNTLRLRLNFNQ